MFNVPNGARYRYVASVPVSCLLYFWRDDDDDGGGEDCCCEQKLWNFYAYAIQPTRTHTYTHRTHKNRSVYVPAHLRKILTHPSRIPYQQNNDTGNNDSVWDDAQVFKGF